MTPIELENDLLRMLAEGKDISSSDREDDRARTRLKKRGLIAFDRSAWRWILTEAGKATTRTPAPDSDLREAVLAYLSECDNPVPDALHRRSLRNRLRELTGAPAEPSRSVAS